MEKQRVTVKDLASQVDSIERELENLKTAKSSAAPPFYKNIPTIISTIALLFSFGTTYVSYQRTKQQDVHALRAELRILLQRLSAIPKDDVEIRQKYSLLPAAVSLLSGYNAQEHSLLSRQAAEIIRRLPKEQVSAVELTSVGRALLSIDNETADTFLTRAAEVATSLTEEVTALRTHGHLLFTIGKLDEGRVLFRKAFALQAKYKNYDPMTHVQTELAWTGSEHMVGQRERVQERLKSVDEYLAALPAGPVKEMAQAQLNQNSAFWRGPPRVVPILPMPAAPNPTLPGTSDPVLPGTPGLDAPKPPTP
jgi:hypothetical protein